MGTKSSTGQDTVRGYLKGAGRTAVAKTATRIAVMAGAHVTVPDRSQASGQGRHRRHGRGQSYHEYVASGASQQAWGIAVIEDRPEWPFDRGDTINIVDILAKVQRDSQVAYGAFLSTIANYRPQSADRDYVQQEAQRLLIEFDHTVRPSRRSLDDTITAKTQAAASTTSPKSHGTAMLRELEENWLRCFTGIGPHMSVTELRVLAEQTVEALAGANSDDRTACARLIFANILMISDRDFFASARELRDALEHYKVPVHLHQPGTVASGQAPETTRSRSAAGSTS